MPGAADWQNLPNSVTDAVQNNSDAEAWAQDQQNQIAQDWGDLQRTVPEPKTIPPPGPPAGLQNPQEASAPAGPAEAVYNVQPGDTLSSIAQRLGVPVSQLVTTNKISNPNLIQAGQVLNTGTTTAAPVGPGAGASTGAGAGGNVPDWLVQTIQNNTPDELKDDPEFTKIVASGAKAESNWDPNSVQQGGGGRGLFQFDVKGMGSGLTAQQLFDPNYQASKIIPKYAAAYAAGKAQGLTGAELASYTAAQAEHPLGYDNPQSAARQNYRDAYNGIQYTGQPAPTTVADQPDRLANQTPPAVVPAGGPTPVENQRQFEDEAGLTDAQAYSACGPVAAVAFAKTYGRNPTPQEAIQLARQVGWTPQSGMRGIASEQALLTALGTETKIEQNVNWTNVQNDVQNGNPVIISTPNHYFYVSAYDPQSQTFTVGESGTVFKGGASQMSQADIAKLGGGISGALYVDHPQAEGPSVAETGTPPAGAGDQNPIGTAANAVKQKAQDVIGAVQSLLPNFDQGQTPTTSNQVPPQQPITAPPAQSPTAPVTAPLQAPNVLNQGSLAGASQAVTSTLANQSGTVQPGNANDLLNTVTNAGADAIVNADHGLDPATKDTTKALVATGLSIYLGLVQPEAAGAEAGAAGSALGDEQSAIAQVAANGHASELTAKLRNLTDLVNQSRQATSDATQTAFQNQVNDLKASIDQILHPTYDQYGVATNQDLGAVAKTPAPAASAPPETATAPQPATAPPPAPDQPPAVTFDQNGNQLTGPVETPATASVPPAGQPPSPPPPAASAQPPARPLVGRGGVPGADVGRQPMDLPQTADEAMQRFQDQVNSMTTRPIDDVKALVEDKGGTATTPTTTPAATPTEAAPAGQVELGAGVNPGTATNSVLNPAANARPAVQDAVNAMDHQINGSKVMLDQAVRDGTITQDMANQAQGRIKAKAFTQFVQDIKNANDPDAIRPKWQSGTALQRGTALPKPDGWADGRQFSGLEDFYLSPETRDVVQNIWNQQFKNTTPLLSGLNQATSIAKEISLGGTFHMAQTGIQAAGLLRNDAPGVMGRAFIAAVDPTGKIFDSIVSDPQMKQTMVNAAADGVTQLGKNTNQGDYAQMMKGWQGLAARMATGAAGGALTKGPVGAAEGAALGAFSHYITPATFERWIPILKAGSYQSLVDRGVSGPAAASIVNNTLGGQNLARMARSPLVSELSRTMLLAPDWWESFGRQISQTVAPNLSPESVEAKMATATTLVGLAATTEALSYAFSGHSTMQNPDPAHRADIDMTRVWGPDPKTGQDQYLVIGGRFGDLINAITSANPGKMILSRAGIAPNLLVEGATGQNLVGHSPEDVGRTASSGSYKTLVTQGNKPGNPNFLDKAVSVGADQLKNLYPAGAQSVDSMAQSGGLPAAVASFLTGAREQSTKKPPKTPT